METHLYTICWNEADILPFFFRHYDPWVDRYIVFDNGSTDDSIELLTQHRRVELRKFPWSKDRSFVLSQQDLYNNVWKESRGLADWVVITAIDEHLHVPQRAMSDFLLGCARAGTTCVPALGYQMISEDFPQPHETLCLSRTRGAPWRHMNKLSLFNPLALQETHYETGRHKALPVGRIVFPRRDQLLLLHYKLIGFERTYQHNAREVAGLREYDLAKNWQRPYAFSRDEMRAYWNTFARNAVDVADPNLRPWATNLEKRWWRSKLYNLTNQIIKKSRSIWSRNGG